MASIRAWDWKSLRTRRRETPTLVISETTVHWADTGDAPPDAKPWQLVPDRRHLTAAMILAAAGGIAVFLGGLWLGISWLFVLVGTLPFICAGLGAWWAHRPRFVHLAVATEDGLVPVERVASGPDDITPADLAFLVDEGDVRGLLEPAPSLMERVQLGLLVTLALGMGFLIYLLWSASRTA